MKSTSSLPSNNKNREWIHTESTGKEVIDRNKLYVYIKEHSKIIITDRGNYLRYDGKIYRSISEREIKALIKSFLPVEFRNRKDWDAVFEEFQTD